MERYAERITGKVLFPRETIDLTKDMWDYMYYRAAIISAREKDEDAEEAHCSCAV